MWGERNCLSFVTVVGGIEPPSPRLTVRCSTARPPLLTVCLPNVTECEDVDPVHSLSGGEWSHPRVICHRCQREMVVWCALELSTSRAGVSSQLAASRYPHTTWTWTTPVSSPQTVRASPPAQGRAQAMPGQGLVDAVAGDPAVSSAVGSLTQSSVGSGKLILI